MLSNMILIQNEIEAKISSMVKKKKNARKSQLFTEGKKWYSEKGTGFETRSISILHFLVL